jgi:circadian clock protein KaiC
MRGQAHLGGSHVFRITNSGVRIYPRVLPLIPEEQPNASIDHSPVRIPTGTPQLDDMLNGGLPRGHSMLIVGPSGSGKTIMGTAFLAEGVRLGEKGIAVFFEKTTSRLRNSRLSDMVRKGDVHIVESRLLDLSVEELVDDLIQAINRTGAKRVLIDSLSEFGLYLAPEFRSDIRGVAFRVLGTLAKLGISVVVTTGLEDRFTDLRFSQAEISFLTDAIVALRYVETQGRLVKLISVVKVRGSAHSTDLREYVISDRGIEIGERPVNFEGLLSGHPSMRDPTN